MVAVLLGSVWFVSPISNIFLCRFCFVWLLSLVSIKWWTNLSIIYWSFTFGLVCISILLHPDHILAVIFLCFCFVSFIFWHQLWKHPGARVVYCDCFHFLLSVLSTISVSEGCAFRNLECLSHYLSPNQKILFYKPSVSAECPPTTCCTSWEVLTSFENIWRVLPLLNLHIWKVLPPYWIHMKCVTLIII